MAGFFGGGISQMFQKGNLPQAGSSSVPMGQNFGLAAQGQQTTQQAKPFGNIAGFSQAMADLFANARPATAAEIQRLQQNPAQSSWGGPRGPSYGVDTRSHGSGGRV